MIEVLFKAPDGKRHFYLWNPAAVPDLGKAQPRPQTPSTETIRNVLPPSCSVWAPDSTAASGISPGPVSRFHCVQSNRNLKERHVLSEGTQLLFLRFGARSTHAARESISAGSLRRPISMVHGIRA